MYEVERKVRADHRAIRARLDDLGLPPGETVVQIDTYLNHPQRDFAATDEALRIRREHPEGDPDAGVAVLAYKGPRLASDAKTREEHETVVDDAAVVRSMFESLGFSIEDQVSKRRVRYEQSDVVICLDTVDELGEFVELETRADTIDELPAAERRVDSMLAQLDIETTETITTPYLTMLQSGRAGSEGADIDPTSRSP